MVKLGRILAFVAVLSLVFPLACAQEQEPDMEDPRDYLVETLKLADEQLQQLETGTGTLDLREDQVDILSDYVTHLLDDLQPRLDQARWQEVKDILEGMLTAGEVDLETLGPVIEAIRDSLAHEAEAGIGVYTNLVKLPTESTATIEDQSQLTDGRQRSTCVTVYTPRNRFDGDRHYEYGGDEQEDTVGWQSTSIAAADSYSGAIGAEVCGGVAGGASAYALQRILINVPVDATDIDITARLLYSDGTSTFAFGGAETGIVTVCPYQSHQDATVLEQVLDPLYGWDDALKWALTILTTGYSLTVESVAFGLSLAWYGLDEMAYQSALQEYGEQKIVTYSADSLPAGDYIFEIGVYSRVESYLGFAKAFAIGMVRDIEVTMNIPSLTLDITSTDGGYVIEPGEGTFPCCPEEDVDIVAVSYQGYRFTGWTGDVDTVDRADIQSTFITMNGDYSITANFEAVQYDLTIYSTTGGSVNTPGEGTFPCDASTTVNLVARPDSGYRFVEWTGDVDWIEDVNDLSTTILMLDDYSITANFEEIPPVQYDLTISSTTGGSVTTPGEGTFTRNAGTVVNLVATPASGYQFDKWTGDVGIIADVNAASTTITMNDDYSIRANFEKEEEVCPSIWPTANEYDLANPGQVTTTITWNDASSIASIHDGTAYLALGTHYTVSHFNGTATLTILNAYLAGKLTTVGQSVVLTITFDICTPVPFSITAIDTAGQTCATISPTTDNYDLANPGDFTTTITWNDASSITSIHDGSGYLTAGTDYTVVGNTLTILNAYLAGKLTTAGQSVVLTITFDICPPIPLTITAEDDQELEITAASDSKPYDGTPLTNSGYSITSGTLAAGHTLDSVTVTGSQTDVGSSGNVPSNAVILDGAVDVTADYDITYVNGTLTVTPIEERNLEITATSDSKPYDGTPLTNNGYSITSGALAAGHTLDSVTVTGSQTDVGSSGNVPSNAVILDGAVDVTADYDITYVNGTLTVTGEVVYDEEYVNQDSFVMEFDPYTNLNSLSPMLCGEQPGGYRNYVYLKFDFDDVAIPESADIDWALLWIHVDGALGTTFGYTRCHRVIETWSETTITWDNRPNSSGEIRSKAIGSSGWHNIVINNTVRGWLDETYENHGLMLRLYENVGLLQIGVNAAYIELKWQQP